MIYILFVAAILIYYQMYFLLFSLSAMVLGTFIYFNLSLSILLFQSLISRLRSLLMRNVKIDKHRGYMHIQYNDHGEDYDIFVPLRVDNSLEYSQCRIAAVYKEADGKQSEKEIKQESEVPILVTAKDMGASYIRVINTFSGEAKDFTGNEIVVPFLDFCD